MRPKEIKKLIELVEQSTINELEVSRWGKKVRIRKSPSSVSPTVASESVNIPIKQAVAPTKAELPPSETIVEPVTVKEAPEKPSTNIVEVRSPMVGTFYRAPAPDAASFVQVGDLVSPNQVLCIIEAMKLMNDIEAEVRGRIIEILVENAQPVEYNQILFRIEKL